MAYNHALKYDKWRDQFIPAANKAATAKVPHTHELGKGTHKWNDKAAHKWLSEFAAAMERLVAKRSPTRANKIITAEEYQEYMRLKRAAELRIA